MIQHTDSNKTRSKTNDLAAQTPIKPGSKTNDSAAQIPIKHGSKTNDSAADSNKTRE